MGMNVGSADDGDEDQVVSSINTTPLVDVMLVLLIIFLITIPVVTHTAPVNLPKETNIPTETRPENIIIAVTQEGDMYWGTEKLADANALVERLKEKAVLKPQPELHIRGDRDARYEFVGRVVVAAQRAGIVKVGFISEPATGVGTVKRVGQ